VFKNPTPSSAGALIDRAGLKGFSVGKAKISDKHGNFIITERGATATDVYLLVQFIKEKIKNTFDIDLVEEVEFVGEF
jgi:UDP-N-acetylmuramate dehydrogenase